MFRIDSEYVIDATRSGNMARYINHSCDPNCFTQIVNVDNTKKIVIFANRPIKAGEEVSFNILWILLKTNFSFVMIINLNLKIRKIKFHVFVVHQIV